MTTRTPHELAVEALKWFDSISPGLIYKSARSDNFSQIMTHISTIREALRAQKPVDVEITFRNDGGHEIITTSAEAQRRWENMIETFYSRKEK